MPRVEAELKYFPDDVKRQRKVEVKADDIIKIGKKYNTDIKTREKLVMRFKQLVVTVGADDEVAVKNCVKDIIKLYGKPDLPSLVFGSRKRGKELVKSAIKELLG
jgi:hypothetical protein